MGNLSEMFMQLDKIAEQRLRVIELRRYGISVNESSAEAMACEQMERDQAAEYLKAIEELKLRKANENFANNGQDSAIFTQSAESNNFCGQRFDQPAF